MNSCGNDGGVGREEKQSALSLPSHITLESSQTTRPSHIPTAAAEKKNDNFKQKLFNFNFDEKCYLLPRYLLLPKSPVAQVIKATGL